MITLLISVVILSAPPAGNQQLERRQRVTEIHALAKADSPDKIKAYVAVLNSGEVWEKHAALLALRAAHKPFVKRVLNSMVSSKKPTLRLEACVQRYRMGRSKKNALCLKKLRDLGSNLRRAFQTGEKRGRPVYDKRGEAFFLESVRHSNLYTRLDGALGLIEHDPKGRGKAGLVVFEQELNSARVEQRRTVVRHLSVQYSDHGLRKLLESARKDVDPTVRAVAEEILARQ